MQGYQVREDEGQQPLHMLLPLATSRKIDEYRRRQPRIQTRTAAIRELLEQALDNAGIKDIKKK